MIGGILVGFDKLAIEDTPVVEVRMEVQEARVTPEEEERDLLLLTNWAAHTHVSVTASIIH